jgi:hypothetical protein
MARTCQPKIHGELSEDGFMVKIEMKIERNCLTHF